MNLNLLPQFNNQKYAIRNMLEMKIKKLKTKKSLQLIKSQRAIKINLILSIVIPNLD